MCDIFFDISSARFCLFFFLCFFFCLLFFIFFFCCHPLIVCPCAVPIVTPPVCVAALCSVFFRVRRACSSLSAQWSSETG